MKPFRLIRKIVPLIFERIPEDYAKLQRSPVIFHRLQECTLDLSNYLIFLFIIIYRNVTNVFESISSFFHYQAEKIKNFLDRMNIF
jgi:hypothetical protein